MEQPKFLFFYKRPDGMLSHSYERFSDCYHEMYKFIIEEFIRNMGIDLRKSFSDIELHKGEFSVTCKLDGVEYVFNVVAYEIGKELDIDELSYKHQFGFFNGCLCGY